MNIKTFKDKNVREVIYVNWLLHTSTIYLVVHYLKWTRMLPTSHYEFYFVYPLNLKRNNIIKKWSNVKNKLFCEKNKWGNLLKKKMKF